MVKAPYYKKLQDIAERGDHTNQLFTYHIAVNILYLENSFTTLHWYMVLLQPQPQSSSIALQNKHHHLTDHTHTIMKTYHAQHVSLKALSGLLFGVSKVCSKVVFPNTASPHTKMRRIQNVFSPLKSLTQFLYYPLTGYVVILSCCFMAFSPIGNTQHICDLLWHNREQVAMYI